VRADQREAVEVAANGADIHLPSINGVAILARRAKLATMYISVTISTLFTYVAEDASHMTRTTCDILVETAKWILSLAIVIELERLPKGRPTHRRMAVFTRSGKRPVRIARSCGFAHLCGEQAPGR